MTYETLDWLVDNVWVLTSTEDEDYRADDVFWDTVCVPLFSNSTFAEQFAAKRGLMHWVKLRQSTIFMWSRFLSELQRQGGCKNRND